MTHTLDVDPRKEVQLREALQAIRGLLPASKGSIVLGPGKVCVPTKEGTIAVTLPDLEVPDDFPAVRLPWKAIQHAFVNSTPLRISVHPNARTPLYPPLEAPVTANIQWGAFTLSAETTLHGGGPPTHVERPLTRQGLQAKICLGELACGLGAFPFRDFSASAVIVASNPCVHLSSPRGEACIDLDNGRTQLGLGKVYLPSESLRWLSGLEAEITALGLNAWGHVVWEVKSKSSCLWSLEGRLLGYPPPHTRQHPSNLFPFRAAAAIVRRDALKNAVTSLRKTHAFARTSERPKLTLTMEGSALHLRMHSSRASVDWPWEIPLEEPQPDAHSCDVDPVALAAWLSGASATHVPLLPTRNGLLLFSRSEEHVTAWTCLRK